MPPYPFALVTPATRGLSLALTRHLLRHTSLPVYATYRQGSESDVHAHILSPFSSQDSVDPARLTLLPLDLSSEKSIECAAAQLCELVGSHSDDAYLQTAFFTGGILHPERQPSDINLERMLETFQINTAAHLLLIKHFSGFLPSRTTFRGADAQPPLAKWIHISARVGSVSDNRLGGWYSYRASKAALNQVIKTFDLHLQARRVPAIACGVHPGTVKTDLSKEFWGGVKEGRLFSPEDAAAKIFSTVEELTAEGRGRVWDWKGEEVVP
jgi:NAD(P)-dependent dehydrogenase (short-subunit alcohol dehydrogenase family)